MAVNRHSSGSRRWPSGAPGTSIARASTAQEASATLAAGPMGKGPPSSTDRPHHRHNQNPAAATAQIWLK